MTVLSAIGFDDSSSHEWDVIGTPFYSSSVTPFGTGKSLGTFSTGHAIRLYEKNLTEFSLGFYLFLNVNAWSAVADSFCKIGYTTVRGVYQTTQLTFYVSPLGQISAHLGEESESSLIIQSAVGALQESTWNYITISATIGSSGNVKIKVNGGVVAERFGINTDNASSGFCNVFQLNGPASGAFRDTHFDDVILTDQYNDTFFTNSTPRITKILVPDGDISTDWDGTGVPLTNYTLVDEAGSNDGDSTRVTTDLPNITDIYSVEDVGSPYTPNIKGVMVAVDAGNLPPQLNVLARTTTPTAFFAKPDGSSIFVIGDDEPETVYEFAMGSPGWNLDSASYTGKSFSVSSESDFPHGLWFRDDGTEMYVLEQIGHRIYVYTLSTPWDVSTASLVSGSPQYLNIFPGNFKFSTGLSMSGDGTKLYISTIFSGNNNEIIRQWGSNSSPPIPWDVLNFTYEGEYDIEFISTDCRGTFWNQDGSKLFLIDNEDNFISEIEVGSPYWDITNNVAFTRDHVMPMPYNGTFPIDIAFSPDGTQLLVLWYDLKTIYQFDIGSPGWDPSNLDFNRVLPLVMGFSEGSPQEMIDDKHRPYKQFFENNPSTSPEVGWEGSDINSLTIGMRSQE